MEIAFGQKVIMYSTSNACLVVNIEIIGIFRNSESYFKHVYSGETGCGLNTAS